MLISLAIRDIVLIERLDLELEPGLCVLTGETGAGKSILLDALGLSLGRRADRSLIRDGAAQGTVTAVFRLPADSPARAYLAEHGIDAEDPLILRRVLGQDGRSRAYVSDQPVGSGLLRKVGDFLVEVHGQHELQGLLDPTTQRRLVDAYGGLPPQLEALREAWLAWRQAEAEREEIAAEVERTESDAAYWRHVLTELDQLAPEVGEETILAERRTRLMNREKLAAALQEASTAVRDNDAIDDQLGHAQRTLERARAFAGEALETAVAALDRARLELEEARRALEQAGAELDVEAERLEQVEERLFALRAAARKHQVAVDDLPGLRETTATRLAAIDAGGSRLAEATAAAASARAGFVERAREVSTARAKAATALGKAVMAELPPLKLGKARFVARLIPLAEVDWSEHGAERIAFEVATNPGQEPQPIAKIASGGELARLMLALKVVVARVGSTPCLVFDEVDTGIGGATADAVGERLARLGRTVQVLAVTHAPQVAARADHHWRVEKSSGRERATVAVTPLSPSTRRDEIARMLAGAKVTEAARAAADSLIQRSA